MGRWTEQGNRDQGIGQGTGRATGRATGQGSGRATGQGREQGREQDVARPAEQGAARGPGRGSGRSASGPADEAQVRRLRRAELLLQRQRAAERRRQRGFGLRLPSSKPLVFLDPPMTP